MIKTINKALYALAFGTAGALGAALTDGALTVPEVLASFGAGLLAGVAVYKASNTPKV